MKKNLLFLMLMVVLFPLTMKADEIIVGTATGVTNVNPFLSYIRHTWVETIYQADEIGQACDIESIAFNFVESATYTVSTINIYLAETTKSEFEDKSQWIAEDELTLVYSGTNLVIGDTEWETFELNTIFKYSGEKNLALVISKSSEDFVQNLNISCYDARNSIMFTASDADQTFAQYPAGDGLAVYGKKPVMKLTEREAVAGLAAPTNLRAYIRQDIPDFNYKYEITMAWDAVEGATGYDVFVNTDTEQDFHMGYTNGTAYVAGSDKEATLEFYVVAFNDDTESAPSETYTIVIQDDAVEELTSSFNIYPNPVNDVIFIETEMNVEEVVVYDVNGRQQGNKTTGQHIDVKNLSNGVYFVKVKTENGEVVRRFIKK